VLFFFASGRRHTRFSRDWCSDVCSSDLIVLISSRAALGAQTRTAYSATKAGIIGMGRTWALELAPQGITVNMVAPGPIQGTQMRSEEHTSELQSRENLVCRLLLEKKKNQ